MKPKSIPALILVALVLIPALAFGADSTDVTAVPSWLKPVLDMIMGLPLVGPVLLTVLKYVATAGAIFTTVATFLTGISKAVAGIAQLAGLGRVADAVQAFHDKVWPYVAWLSIYNVPPQK